jgi:hypothetical protein
MRSWIWLAALALPLLLLSSGCGSKETSNEPKIEAGKNVIPPAKTRKGRGMPPLPP